MKTLYFNDIAELGRCVRKQYEKYENEDVEDEFLGVSIVAPYEVLIDVLNHLVKNTSFQMKNIHIEEGLCAGYWNEWILTIDPEGQIWVQVAKYETGYVSTEKDVVFVHGDVNSAFVKKNEKENLIAFEIGEDTDTDEKFTDSDTVNKTVTEYDTDDGYHVTVRCNLNAIEALKIVENMEKGISRMNEAFAEMDRFRRLFRW